MYDECTCIFGNHVFWSIRSFSLYLRSVLSGINDYLSMLIRLYICGCQCMPCVQPKSNCLKITVNFGFNNCSFAHPMTFCSFFHPLYLCSSLSMRIDVYIFSKCIYEFPLRDYCSPDTHQLFLCANFSHSIAWHVKEIRFTQIDNY